MIEIVFESKKEYIAFTAEAKKLMHIKGWDMKDLAKQIGRPVGSVRKFFSLKDRSSRFLAAEIANALDMEYRGRRTKDEVT